MQGRRRGQRMARREHDVERLARRQSPGHPVNQLIAAPVGALGRAVGPCVGLAVDAHDVSPALAQARGDARGRGRRLRLLRVARGRAAVHRFEGELRVDHRAERREQGVEAVRSAFERAEHVDERFDRRHVRRRRLSPDAVLAGRWRDEGVPRERRELGVLADHLLRLPPRAVDDDERHRAGRRMAHDVDRARARVEERRRPRRVRQRPGERRRAAPPDADV